MGIQLYGHLVESMVEATHRALESKPEIIDINYGCPVRKIANRGAGAGMLANIPLMMEMTRAIVEASSVPVTVKTRLGWDEAEQDHCGGGRTVAGPGNQCPDHPWPDPGPDVQGNSRLDPDRGGEEQSQDAYPHHWKRGYHQSPWRPKRPLIVSGWMGS